MTASTMTEPNRVIYRSTVMFCILPADLGRHLDELRRFYGDADGLQIVVERRSADRRSQNAGAPDGVERRAGDRRVDDTAKTAAEAGMALPRALRKHANRILCTWRAIPVHLGDARQEADALLAAAGEDGAARGELRMRYHERVYSSVARQMLSRRRALEMTDRVFDELFEHRESDRLGHELSRATGRALRSPAPRRPS